MVYESDFYTTRRPYRTTPSYSTYTTSFEPSRQIKVLPGLGKVHIVHSYDRIVPYVGHKRLTVVTTPPKVWSTTPSVLNRQYDWIENRLRPWVAYSPTNRYLNSDSAVRIIYTRSPIREAYYLPSSLYTNYFRINRPYYWYNWYSSYWPTFYPLRSYMRYWPLYRPLSYYSSYYNTYLPTSSYLLFDDYYRYLKRSRIVYTRNPITTSVDLPITTYRSRVYTPISFNTDYWPVYSRYFDTRYWPIYRSLWPTYRYWSSYLYDFPSYRSLKLQRIFDDETRLIRAQTNSLLKQIHYPVPRTPRSWPITSVRYGYEDISSMPARWSNDNYIHKMLTVSPRTNKVEYMTYYTEPVRKWFGQGHLACVSYAGDRAQLRRRNVWSYEDPVKNDIQLLSYYIAKFRQDKSVREPSKVEIVEEKQQPEITAAE